MHSIQAVILAGAPATITQAAETRTAGIPINRPDDHNNRTMIFANKAMIPINGRPMIEYVVDTLSACPFIEGITIVGGPEEFDYLKGNKVRTVLEPGQSTVDNVKKAIDHLGAGQPILICSCDVPLLSVEAVEEFVNKSEASGADFCYPIVEKSYYEGKFPDIKRTYVKMKDGTFTGGNLVYLRPANLKGGPDIMEKLVEYRKHPLEMAGIFHFSFIIKLFVGMLSISDVENRFQKITGISGRAIFCTHPEIGCDIDKPEQLKAAADYLAKK